MEKRHLLADPPFHLNGKNHIAHFPQILALCESSNAYIILGVDDLDPDL